MKENLKNWTYKDCISGGGLINMGGDNQIQVVPESHARLIASAPDLLEACKLALDTQIRNYGYATQLHLDMGDVKPKLEQAIAKAEGE